MQHSYRTAKTVRARWLRAVACLSLIVPGMAFAADGETLGPGDMISVTVFQAPELSTEARVSSRGTVLLPLLGETRVASMSPIEAANAIAELLEDGRFVVNPQVNVALLEVRSQRVSVLGNVTRPGQYPLDGTGLKLTDVLAMAGGITETGADTVIVMTNTPEGVERREVNVPAMYRQGDLSPNIELQGGDTIFVPAAPMFYVYGAVQRAGAYRLEPGTTVLAALSLGGGLTPRGSERGIKIHRRMPDGSLREMNPSLADPVQANDVIHVRESLF